MTAPGTDDPLVLLSYVDTAELAPALSAAIAQPRRRADRAVLAQLLGGFVQAVRPGASRAGVGAWAGDESQPAALG